MSQSTLDVRNIAIIAHVDHGKTTLVDEMMKYCQIFREGQDVEDCFLDSNDQERERGITILAKNISLNYKGTKINLVDTPGHADFSGEVERVLKLADGCVLLVDAHDGVMPQTKFVLRKALEAGLKPIVVVNKMDRDDAQPKVALRTIEDLFLDLDVDDDLLDFPIVYASGRSGWASLKEVTSGENLAPLMDTIIERIPPPAQPEGDVQMQITSFEHSDYVGRIGIGRVYRGVLKKNTPLTLIKAGDVNVPVVIKQLMTFKGLGKEEVDSVGAGDLCAIVGLADVDIGDTIAGGEVPEALPRISVEEPTLSMVFGVNDSPLYGQEGKYVTSRHIRDFLYKAAEKDVSVRIEPTETENSFKVFGRGVLHISVLIENMRREGYELSVGQPQVVFKNVDGVKHEPIESLVIEAPEVYAGKVIEQVSKRKGEMLGIDYTTDGQVLNFLIPSRGLIGLRTSLLNTCGGDIVMNHRFKEYQPMKDKIEKRPNGVMVSLDAGQIIPYAINNLQDRGTFFVDPGQISYQGMIIGESNKAGDLDLNVQKEKKLSNMRSAGKDKELRIAPATRLSLEQSLEFIAEDEWVEITPKSIRLRKKILEPGKRKRAKNQGV